MVRQRPIRTTALISLAAAALSLTACNLFEKPDQDDFERPEFVSNPMGGEPYGGGCESLIDCRFGLICLDDDTCGVTSAGAVGDECFGTAECEPELICGADLAAEELEALCMERGGSELDGPCALDQDCAAGLRCQYLGFTGVCIEDGDLDFGQPCTETTECQAPLACVDSPDFTQDGTFCFYPLGLFLPDVECAPSDDAQVEGETPTPVPLEFYFDVPGDTAPAEFYRLPFPNDIRLANGRPDLSGHHNPGRQYFGGELLDNYITALQERGTGFSTNPTIYFRSNQIIDGATLIGDGDNASIFFRNIDLDSPNYGNALSFAWFVQPNPAKFICQNYIAARPSWASPLEHGTTYAVWVNDGVRAGNSQTAQRATDFDAVLGEARPSDARQGAAWDAYAPLRAFYEDQGIEADAVMSATVFTTSDPDADLAPLRDAVRALPAPSLENVTVCGEGVTSPCEFGDAQRACASVRDDVTLVHATYRSHVWQQGTAPFLTSGDGGAIAFDALGSPAATEDVCVAMTIPTAPMPASGWPIVMYGHGTGGNYQSFIGDGTAENVAAIDVDGETVRMAALSIDGVQHANRRGGTDYDAETLFYNFVNPLSSLGNVQQGAADYFLLSYMLETLSVDVPGDETVTFDPAQRFFFGHSQGATVGSLFAAEERDLAGVVLSGAGGSLTLSLLNKTSPQDIAGAVEFVLTDGTGDPNEANQYNPLLALLQWWVDPVDPLNVASRYFRQVEETEEPLNVFMSYGFEDTYTPVANQSAFGRAMGVQVATPSQGTLSSFGESPYPVTGNRSPNGVPVTAVVVPGNPGDYDGHFVIFRNAAVRDPSMEFLGTAVLNGTPTVSRP